MVFAGRRHLDGHPVSHPCLPPLVTPQRSTNTQPNFHPMPFRHNQSLHIPPQSHACHQHSRRPLGRGSGQTVAWVVEWLMVNIQIANQPTRRQAQRIRVPSSNPSMSTKRCSPQLSTGGGELF
ncbi:hypothetical protein CCUS01_05899 [Colletotrichum cuscutae]|uniref:Uncharacterized protein n=1 Tax=Colletotrichum cuscutae TaxID=1209917 RepID=A0AAI9Y3T9_9PEZI|nr:hypothetical protein CCUS01_05899 [Colletotrichum cuscutae]